MEEAFWLGTTNWAYISDFLVSGVFYNPVGKGSVTNLHTKVHTLGEAMHLHNDAQMARRPSGALLAAPMEGN